MIFMINNLPAYANSMKKCLLDKVDSDIVETCSIENFKRIPGQVKRYYKECKVSLVDNLGSNSGKKIEEIVANYDKDIELNINGKIKSCGYDNSLKVSISDFGAKTSYSIPRTQETYSSDKPIIYNVAE